MEFGHSECNRQALWSLVTLSAIGVSQNKFVKNWPDSLEVVSHCYSKPCLQLPLKKKTKIGFQNR